MMIAAEMSVRFESASLAARTQQSSEGAAEGGESEVYQKHKRRHEQEQAEAVLRDVEPGKYRRLCRVALLLNRCAQLREEERELAVDLRGAVGDEAREDETAGVDDRHRKEDCEPAKQTQTCTEACAESCVPDLHVIDTENDDGSSNRPKPCQEDHRAKREGKECENCGEGSCEGGVADGHRPDDGIRLRAEHAASETGIEHGALLLGLGKELFGDGY